MSITTVLCCITLFVSKYILNKIVVLVKQIVICHILFKSNKNPKRIKSQCAFHFPLFRISLEVNDCSVEVNSIRSIAYLGEQIPRFYFSKFWISNYSFYFHKTLLYLSSNTRCFSNFLFIMLDKLLLIKISFNFLFLNHFSFF